jgi:2'-hydroxyisoflavone reductase
VRILILGGTAFVGRQFVEAATARGHEVSIFTRGRTNPGLFPAVERLVGDREADLSPLHGRGFDAVVDTSGYLPRVVRASAELLAPTTGAYLFVSSVSAYAGGAVLSEDSPTAQLDDPASEDVGAQYGALKAACERAVQDVFGARALVVRPGLVVGRHDYTGRFGYWPRRVAAGGEVLAPAPPGRRIWFIDVRDLSGWMVRLLESRVGGVFNAVGPESPLTLGRFLDECRTIGGTDATFVWVDEAFLLRDGVAPYTELPLWVPSADGGFPEIDLSRSLAAGLTLRPVAETIRDVLENDDEAGATAFGLPRPQAGLDRARERELLADWRG